MAKGVITASDGLVNGCRGSDVAVRDLRNLRGLYKDLVIDAANFTQHELPALRVLRAICYHFDPIEAG